jgi:hypothetical protein
MAAEEQTVALKAQIESLEDVAEGLRTEYKEIQDPATKKAVYVLDIDGPVDPLPAVRSLKDESARRRIQNTELTSKLAKFTVLGDRDPVAILADLDRIDELKLAAEGKLDEGKINQIVETRVRAKVAPIEREVGQLRTQVSEKDKVIEGYTVKERNRMIGGALSKAARDLKVVDSAMDDIELYGDRVFEVTEDGNVVTKDGVGVTPGLSPKDWLADMQAKRPHWWGPSGGGGAGGAVAGRPGAGSNPWKHDSWNMTEQMAIVRSDRARADKLAQAAGTTVGGAKPKKA